ncbi:MAG: EAL domain-containing protein [Proteobacteria bacterium]|nr:EAL domain-containing protein [Pseudomonadota bacterium]
MPEALRRPLARVHGALHRLPALFRAYEADERDAGRFRARQVQAVMRFTRLGMAVNILNSLFIVWALRRQSVQPLVALWAAAVCVLALLSLRGWLRQRRRRTTATMPPRVLNRAAVNAGVLGAVWGLLPALFYARVDAPSQFFIGIVTTGMICAGGFALSSLPVAATLYVLALVTGGAAGLLQGPPGTGLPLALVLALYTLIVIHSVWTYARTLGARLMAEARADHQHEVIGLLLRDFEDHASDLLWETDAEGRFAHVAQRLATVLGQPPARLRRLRAFGLLARAVHDSDDARSHWAGLRSLLRRRTAFRDHLLCLRAGRALQWWSLSARPLVGDGGAFLGWRGVATDVTDRQLAHRRLSWLAHNDALTGLVNRAQFRELLQALLQPGSGAPPALAVITLDLDGFKQVNDTRGHAAGDLLLQTFGRQLLSVARRSDTVARLGGDEFAMLVRGASDAAALQPLLERLHAALSQPGEAAGAPPLSLRASIGVAIAPQHGDDVDTLLNHADIAMYAAKRDGGHRHCVFHAELAEVGRRRSALAQALEGAAARGEFRLEFQPQVDSQVSRLCGFEALLRWRHPEHGEVGPAEFIAIAESSGLMPAIGDWVLAEACRHAARWPANVSVSINVSASQLAAPGLPARVLAAAAGLRPQQLELEITESALIEDTEGAVATLQALRALGFRTALDDFGTGYSALGYLRRFAFDTLKIDRSFVRDLSHDGEAQVIVDTILAMSRALGMTTVAEGVESRVEAQMLRERGCQRLQGFLISQPLPAAQVGAFIEAWAEQHRPAAAPRMPALAA